MSRRRDSTAAGYVLLFACACAASPSSEPTAPEGPQSPSTAPPPPSLQLIPGVFRTFNTQTVPIQALLDEVPIAAMERSWSVGDPAIGAVSSIGVFSATPCERWGTTQVRAVLSRNAAVRSSSVAQVVLPPWYGSSAVIQAIRRADQLPVQLDAIRGHLEIEVAYEMLCRAVSEIRLDASSPLGTMVVGSVSFDPARSDSGKAAFLWNTGESTGGTPAYPNGDYSLSAVWFESGSPRWRSNGIPVRLRNE